MTAHHPQEDAFDSELELGTRQDGRPLRIPASSFNYHAHVIGPPGIGKTKFLELFVQQAALKTDSAIVFIDPTGNAYNFLKRWCYSQALDDRLVLIDPGEERLICGFNPVNPWPRNHLLQAAVAWENMRRAMETQDFATAPLLDQWMCNVLYALITTRLTMHESVDLLDFHDPRIRQAVIQRMPDGSERHDFEMLQELTEGSRLKSALEMWQQQTGSSYRRIKYYTRSDTLKLMLGTRERVIDWDQILEDRKIVLVNLSPAGERGRLLTESSMRMLGIQLLTELFQVVLGRKEHGTKPPIPCFLIVDECYYFICPDMEHILQEGRQYKLRIVLAHQSLSQLTKQGDDRLVHIVSDCTRLKVAFGGLSYRTAEEMTYDLYAHHLNLKAEPKDIITQLRQLSYVEEVETRHDATGGGSVEMFGSNAATSYQTSEDAKLLSQVESSAVTQALSNVSNWAGGVSRGPMVKPTAPFPEITSRQWWTVQELIHQCLCKLIGKGEREGVIAVQKGDPIEFTVSFVPDPSIEREDALSLDLDLMRALPYYNEPKLITQEIEDRRSDLLNAVVPPRTRISDSGRKD